jgi:hypothetical protein
MNSEQNLNEDPCGGSALNVGLGSGHDLSAKLSHSLLDIKTMVVYGDAYHDDTDALQAYLNGDARIFFPDGEEFRGSRNYIDQDWGNGRRFRITKALVIGAPNAMPVSGTGPTKPNRMGNHE